MASSCVTTALTVLRLSLSAEGGTVWHSVNNEHKKAGALNQAWERLSDHLSDDDHLFVMDADSHLDEGFIAAALAKHEDGYGGVGGTFRDREGGGFVGMLQRNEYVRYVPRDAPEARQGDGPHRNGDSCSASMHCALSSLLVMRGTLPFGTGSLYDTDVLTEDNELSLALRTLGYRIVPEGMHADDRE